MRPRLFGMITTKHSADYTVEALDSFFRYTNFREGLDRMILIDNDGAWNSQPGFRHSSITVDINKSESGFAENANKLLRKALKYGCDLYLMNNDLIFTDHWTEALDISGDSICSPFSNREVKYSATIKVIKPDPDDDEARPFISDIEMNLLQYQGHKYIVQAIAEKHRNLVPEIKSFWSVLVLPYFCVRIPLQVIERVGFFDEDFGKGGGEDYDYSLRAYLAGVPVQYALKSWIVHFYGKSSWSGVDDAHQRQLKQQHIFDTFRKKWGEKLLELVFMTNHQVITDNGLNIPNDTADFIAIIKKLKAS